MDNITDAEKLYKITNRIFNMNAFITNNPFYHHIKLKGHIVIITLCKTLVKV